MQVKCLPYLIGLCLCYVPASGAGRTAVRPVRDDRCDAARPSTHPRHGRHQRLACAELDVGCLTRLAQHPRVGALAEGLERTGVRGGDALGRARGVGPLAREPRDDPAGDVVSSSAKRPFVPAHTTVISTLGGSASMIASRFSSEPTRTSSALPVAAMIAGVPLVVQSTSSAPSPPPSPAGELPWSKPGIRRQPRSPARSRPGARRHSARSTVSQQRTRRKPPSSARRSWIPRAARRRRPPSRRAGPPRA
jgi:hypothetical protein